MAMKIISVSDIEGFKLGNAENEEKATGCTVIVCEAGAVGGVDVRGGGPATRETDLLRSENSVESVNAVVLSGGSAFGLEAASGVMRELAEREIGFNLDNGIYVPIVCGASLYDLPIGDPKAFPDVEMGIQAVRNAYAGEFDHGNHGAGTGATVGKIKGYDRAMKSGLGTFACGDAFVQVGAIAAVNACGDIYNGAGNIIAGLRTEEGQSIYGTIKALKSMVHENDSIANESSLFIKKSEIEAIFAKPASKTINYEDLEAEAAKIESNTSKQGPADENPEDSAIPEPVITELTDEAPAAEVLIEEEHVVEEVPVIEEEPVVEEEHVVEDVSAVEDSPVIEEAPVIEDSPVIAEAPVAETLIAEDTVVPEPFIIELPAEEPADEVLIEEEPVIEEIPVFEETTTAEVPTAEKAPVNEEISAIEEIFTEEEPVEEPAIEEAPKVLSREEMGYDITFNTTIGCLITNAALTKPQANKLASILHDAYARAIKPVHSSLDGDTIFVLATGKQKVNFDAFAALATDVMQYAVIDGAMSAEGAYGLPSAKDMKKAK